MRLAYQSGNDNDNIKCLLNMLNVDYSEAYQLSAQITTIIFFSCIQHIYLKWSLHYHIHSIYEHCYMDGWQKRHWSFISIYLSSVRIITFRIGLK